VEYEIHRLVLGMKFLSFI